MRELLHADFVLACLLNLFTSLGFASLNLFLSSSSNSLVFLSPLVSVCVCCTSCLFLDLHGLSHFPCFLSAGFSQQFIFSFFQIMHFVGNEVIFT